MVNKEYFAQADVATISAEDLEKINKFSLKELTADEVYTFLVTLCDNEIDRDYERFSIPALEKLAEMFVGKTGIFDHSMCSRDQTARIYATEIAASSQRKTACGEPYTCIKAKAYMARTVKNADLISEIEAGIKKEVSVGCAIGKITCSVCGSDLIHSKCVHRKGKVLSGKMCHSILSDPTDAYEWSFVAVPAQVSAGVTKTYLLVGGEREMGQIINTIKSAKDAITLSSEEVRSLSKHMEFLETQAMQATVFRKELEEELLGLSAFAVPEIDSSIFKAIFPKLTVEELLKFKKDLRGAADHKVAPMPQLAVTQKNKADNNSAFQI